MKVLVAVKRVVDPYVRIRIKADGSGVDTTNLKKTMNPFDEIALEEAMRLKEAERVEEVIIVSIGPEEVKETLRHGLALGAERAKHIQHDQPLEPLLIAKLLKEIVLAESVPLVLMGKQAIDGDENQTGQMLAALLGWAQATFVSKINFTGEKSLEVAREVDAGIERLALELPLVITTDLRLNQPRYASLPNIMRAKQKSIETMMATDFKLDLTPRQQYLQVRHPKERQRGQTVATVQELVEKLHTQEGIV